jgi:hypothetical protein
VKIRVNLHEDIMGVREMVNQRVTDDLWLAGWNKEYECAEINALEIGGLSESISSESSSS